MPPTLAIAGRGTHPGSTARYYARRARARAARIPVTANVPMTFGIPSAPRKEDITELRLDILGPVIRQHLPVVPDGSRRNLVAAFDKRCNHFSDARVHPEIIRANQTLLDKIAPRAWDPLVYDRPLFEEWNAQFDSVKQARHVKAYSKITDATLKDFSDKQIFVKVEALLKRHDPNWAPRIIYQSSDLHNVLLGPVMWKCCKRMFASLEFDNSDNGARYMGAYAKNTDALVDFITRDGSADSVFVESDFSSNDMTQVKDVHMLEVQWLTRFGAPAWLTALMLLSNSFRVRSIKHSVKASIQNQLPTGAQSTTFRNSMWNATINFRFCQRVGARSDCLLLGDDMLMRYDNPMSSKRKNIRREYEHVCRLAHMEAKVAVYNHLSECHFLSKHFVMLDSGSYAMVPFLGKAYARFNIRASSNESVTDEAYLAGKCLSYAYEFRAAPSLSRMFLHRYTQLGVEGFSLDGLGWNAKGAFLRLGVEGVLAAIESPAVVARSDDLTRFYHWRYGLTHQDLIVRGLALLFGEDDLDVDSLAWIMDE